MKNLINYSLATLVAICLLSCKTSTEKELSFLTFNVWQEGTSVPNGLQKIHDVIIETNPDIICFVEVRNYKSADWTTKIINALAESGQKYYRGYSGGDVSLISKYPINNSELIYTNTDKGTVANFHVNVNGNIIVVSGVHLDYTFYASNLPRGYNGGDPNWKIIDDGEGNPLPNIGIDSIQKYNLKSKRDEAISSFLASIENETNPVVLMGDFNEPSWLDWTEKTKNMFNHSGAVIPWYNTRKLYKEGFIDAYRTYFPNEVTHPGFTWPAYAHEKKSTSWTPLADERDRVDYIFYKGNGVKLVDAAMVGPKECYVYNKLSDSDTDKEIFIGNNLAWPTDHKAVFVKLSFILDN